MKAITLWQPWASLIAVGAKTIETRSWATPYRGPLAIHAAKVTPAWVWAEISKSPCRQFLEELFPDLQLDLLGCIKPNQFPAGVIVATCDLFSIQSTLDLEQVITERERCFGDYSTGRYGWILHNARALNPPVPARGKQLLWEWER
jgi:hypothetical protein